MYLHRFFFFFTKFYRYKFKSWHWKFLFNNRNCVWNWRAITTSSVSIIRYWVVLTSSEKRNSTLVVFRRPVRFRDIRNVFVNKRFVKCRVTCGTSVWIDSFVSPVHTNDWERAGRSVTYPRENSVLINQARSNREIWF